MFGSSGETVLLSLNQSARFQVYESKKIALAPGDVLRITQNGFTKDKQRLNNGDLKQVKGLTKDGDIKLANGWVISKDYGNLTHGYCLTSYSCQSKGVDCVFVAEASESFRAADREQFYVSASRFKEALTIYTDDKQRLLGAVAKSSRRPSAIDLVIKQSLEIAAPGDFKERVAEGQAAGNGIAQAQTDSQAPTRDRPTVRRQSAVHRRVQQSQSNGITI
jgi:hypothetical protein